MIRHVIDFGLIFPILKLSNENQKIITDIVNNILEITEAEDYAINPEKQAMVKEYEKN